MTKDIHTGGCVCGAIRYEVAGPIEQIIQCHCLDCQKATGTGASANISVLTDDFRLIRGAPKVFTQVVQSGRTAHRAFCGNCGSPIWSGRENSPERTMLKAGTLDDSSSARIVLNIWTSSAAHWMAWDRDLPSHENNRPV